MSDPFNASASSTFLTDIFQSSKTTFCLSLGNFCIRSLPVNASARTSRMQNLWRAPKNIIYHKKKNTDTLVPDLFLFFADLTKENVRFDSLSNLILNRLN